MKHRVLISKIEEGQKFEHAGYTYERATEQEVGRHPGRRPNVVMAYHMQGKAGRVPVTFNQHVRVWVRGG